MILLAADLAQASQDDMKTRLLSRQPHSALIYKQELLAPLQTVAKAIPPAVAAGSLKNAIRQIEIFNLFGARLDIRADSARINMALRGNFTGTKYCFRFCRFRCQYTARSSHSANKRSHPTPFAISGGISGIFGDLGCFSIDQTRANSLWSGSSWACDNLHDAQSGRCIGRLIDGEMV